MSFYQYLAQLSFIVKLKCAKCPIFKGIFYFMNATLCILFYATLRKQLINPWYTVIFVCFVVFFPYHNTASKLKIRIKS